MYAVKLINRHNGIEKTFKTMEKPEEAWEFMMTWNNRHCMGFKGYDYGKGMRRVMYYVDGSAGAVCDIMDMDDPESAMDYTIENNIRKDA